MSSMQEESKTTFRDNMRVSVSNAEVKLAVKLQIMKNHGEIDDIGRSDIEIPVRITRPDRVWENYKVALYLDGEEVHDLEDPWDGEVDWALRKQGYTVIRERYKGQLSDKRRDEIISKVLAAIGKAKACRSINFVENKETAESTPVSSVKDVRELEKP